MFGKGKKQQIIELKINNNDYENMVVFKRGTCLVEGRDAQLKVPGYYQAYMIKNGERRLYDEGIHKVFDDSKDAKQWKDGFAVEVIYMLKESVVQGNWAVKRDELLFRDKMSNKVVNVGMHGEFFASIANHEQFIRRFVGPLDEVDMDMIKKRLSSTISMYAVDIFAHMIDKMGLSYDKFDIEKVNISNAMKERIGKLIIEECGLSLERFTIDEFFMLDEDKQKVEDIIEEQRAEQKELKREAKLKEYLAELERLDDKQWEREKYLKQLEQEDNLAYYDVLKAIGKQELSSKNKGANFCPKCGHSCETTDDFCPNCGNRMGQSSSVCPQCNKVNSSSAVYCSGCGKKLR